MKNSVIIFIVGCVFLLLGLILEFKSISMTGDNQSDRRSWYEFAMIMCLVGIGLIIGSKVVV